MIKKINIKLFKSEKVPDRILNHCVETIKSFPSFQIEKINIKPINIGNNFHWEECFRQIEQTRQSKKINPTDFVVLLTEERNIDNWFAAFDQENNSKNIFIQTSEWHDYIYTNQVHPVTYEIIANVMQAIMYENTEKSLEWTHEHSKGCMNDFCGWKPDIQYKLKTAEICSDCLSILEKTVSEGILKDSISCFDKIRLNVIGNSKYFEPPSYEESFFSPIAITKRKISSHSDPLRKTLYAIDHFDLIVKTHLYVSLALNSSEEEILIFLEKYNLTDKPSLGHWVAGLSAIPNFLQNSIPESGNMDEVKNNTKRILSIAEQDNIVQIRNEKRGHGYIGCVDGKYSNTFINLNSSLLQIENAFTNAFSGYYLIRALSCSKKESNNYKISYNILIGSNMLLEVKESSLNFNPDFIDDKIYLVSKDLKNWHNLSPYIIMDDCPECHHPRLMIKDGGKYIDIYAGHRVTINTDNKT